MSERAVLGVLAITPPARRLRDSHTSGRVRYTHFLLFMAAAYAVKRRTNKTTGSICELIYYIAGRGWLWVRM